MHLQKLAQKLVNSADNLAVQTEKTTNVKLNYSAKQFLKQCKRQTY